MAQIKPTEQKRGLLQQNFVYLQLKLRGASREDAIRAIKCGNSAFNIPELGEALLREDLLEPDSVDLLTPLRVLVR